MVKCIITGCDLIIPHEGKWCHGDLWREGSCYVFSACVSGGDTAWQYDQQPEGKSLTIHVGEDYFERRAVIVVDKMSAQLNEEALNYVGP